MEYTYFLTLMNDLGTSCNGVMLQFLEGLFRRHRKEKDQSLYRLLWRWGGGATSAIWAVGEDGGYL